MFTEREIIDKIEKYKDNPESAEAWYLASQKLKSEQINRNLRIKYGSAQGFATLKEDVEELTGYELNSENFGIRFSSDDSGTYIYRATVTDINDSFQDVVQDVFLNIVEKDLRDRLEEMVSDFSKEVKLLVEILRRGSTVGNFTKFEPAWDLYTFLKGREIPDPEKNDIQDLLVSGHCYYYGLGISPMLKRISSKQEFLPEIKVEYSE